VITGVPDSLTNVFYQARLAIGNATSIDPTLAAQYRLSLQPNPSMGETQLAFTLPQAAEVSYEIHDLFGRSLYQHPSQRMAEGRQSLPVQAPRLTAGVYIVKLNVNRGEAILSKRWVVQ
ncbi:MAG: T9SS type A sorting domain-containing protein, partial [Bacteroidota bacterium]